MHSFGITTTSFNSYFDDLFKDTIKTIKWAKENNFSFVEVRDSALELSSDKLKKIGAYADKVNMKLTFAWDINNVFLQGNDELMKSVIVKVAIFGKGTILRTIIGTPRNANRKHMIAYNDEQLEYVCLKVKEYDELARQYGVVLTYENSIECVFGNGNLYGLNDVMEKAQEFKVTFDMSNVVNRGIRQNKFQPADAEKFFEMYKNRIPYIHIKTTKNNRLKKSLDICHDVDFGKYLSEAPENTLMCIELPACVSLSSTKRNVCRGKNLLTKIEKKKVN